MPIINWPIADRPREKLLSSGEKNLTDAELLAIILKTGKPGKSALDIAKELLSKYGGLKPLFHASFHEIQTTSGIGLAKYAAVKAAIELGQRYLQQPLAIGEKLSNSVRVQIFLADRLKHHQSEVFASIFLDQHCRFIAFNKLFYGSIHEAPVYPREIVRRCITYNAAKIILAHNHPSGIATPSNGDKEVTLHIQKSLSLIDVQVIDHIIVGKDKHFSFAEEGLL